jgi:alanine racemase
MTVQTASVETRPLPKGGTWIEVDLDRISRNLERVREKIRPFTRVMAVVKANAYGHGLIPVSQALQGKVDFLGIGSLREAAVLREQGITTPLFLFGRLLPDEIQAALQMNLVVTVSSFEEARLLSEAGVEAGKKARVHVKVDTGMGRLGIPYSEALPEIEKMAFLPAVHLDGIYTHFPAAERYPDAFGIRQLTGLETLIQDLRRKKITFSLRHAANSAGALRFKSHRLNLVRTGIALYGIPPDPSFRAEIDLEPALALKSRIVHLKRLGPGDSVSYGRDFVAKDPTTIAVLPTGYAHGYPVHLSSRGEVLYRGKRFRVAGRVSMDFLMIDLGNSTEPRIGDEVTLLGASEGEEIRAEELASLAGTIPYEIVTRLEARIPRLYKRQPSSTEESSPSR